MDDESDDDLVPIEGEEPPFDARFHFGSHGAMAGFAALSGVVSWLAVHTLPIPTLKRFFEETGIVLPAITELVISWQLPFVSLALGLVTAAAVAGLSTLKDPKVSWPLGLVGLVLCFLPTSICVLHAMAMRYGMMEQMLRSEDGRGELEPGRTSEIAGEVLEGLRSGLTRGVGTFETPSGERRRYFIAEGPGLPKGPRELPPYEEARALPGCVVLPWAAAAEPNTAREREVSLLFPSGAQGGLPPAALGANPAGPWLLTDASYQHVTADDTPALVYPATHLVTNSDYSWALVLTRARVDANGDGVISPGPAAWNPRGQPADPYSDHLLEVRVQVFRRFDSPSDPQDPVVPWTNVPQNTFLTLVRLP